MINFNVPIYIGEENEYINKVIKNRKISGDGEITSLCHKWFEENLCIHKALLTTSGTHALEMAAFLCDIKIGDEVIMPSYTFVSTANAFLARGAKIVFVDIRPDTMNIDERVIENAITHKTKAIVVVHYAGVSCEMDKIKGIAQKYNLFIVEDNAQGLMSKYKNEYLGKIGDFGCVSFHETKNFSMGEGGVLFLKDKMYVERAEILREKGTNRSKFFRGQIDKYTWVDYGSSYLPSELNAAYLYPQLKIADKIIENRMKTWNLYYRGLFDLCKKGFIELPSIPLECKHNAHMFYIKVKDLNERTNLISFLVKNDIGAVFHYVPLHSSPAGEKYGIFVGEDKYTTRESDRLIRLPLYYGIEEDKIYYIVKKVYDFFENVEVI